jgi:hypothetical protein
MGTKFMHYRSIECSKSWSAIAGFLKERKGKLPLFNLVRLPPFAAVWVGDWKLKQPARYFIAAQTSGDFREVIGLPVIDEFATFSGAILFGPGAVLGKLYNAGISLGHWRDPEMSIDTGWPPLAVGTGESAGEMDPDWEPQLLQRIKEEKTEPAGTAINIDLYSLQLMTFGQAKMIATDAPLLPGQLRRLCQTQRSPFTLAFSIANVLSRQKDAAPLTVRALSEERLRSILEAAGSIA